MASERSIDAGIGADVCRPLAERRTTGPSSPLQLVLYRRRILPRHCIYRNRETLTDIETRLPTQGARFLYCTQSPLYSACNAGMLHTWLSKDCSLWSPRAQQTHSTHSERSQWSR